MRVLLVLVVLGCASVPPSTPREAFQSIGSDYIVDKHDCDDMAQEFADWLALSGVSREDMRFVSASHNYYRDAPHHFWLEVWHPDGWCLYDVASGDYAVPIEGSMLYENYDAHYIPSVRVYRDGGYQCRGDRWVDGRWLRGRPGQSVKGN